MQSLPRPFVAAAAAFALMLAAPGTAAAALTPFFDSESNGGAIGFDPASAVFADVKGAGFDADERLAALEIVTTARDAGGKAVTRREVLATLCQRRVMLLQPATGQKIPAEGWSFDKFGSTGSDTRMERLRLALCDGELIGVPPSRNDGKRSGWMHYLEGDRQALYLVVGGTAELSARHVAARVRLYQFGGGQFADGLRYDARDAVWVIDCRDRLGAVSYERYFARTGQEVKVVATMGDEAVWKQLGGIDTGALKFAAAAPGSIQARYTADLCASPARKAR